MLHHDNNSLYVYVSVCDVNKKKYLYIYRNSVTFMISSSVCVED